MAPTPQNDTEISKTNQNSSQAKPKHHIFPPMQAHLVGLHATSEESVQIAFASSTKSLPQLLLPLHRLKLLLSLSSSYLKRVHDPFSSLSAPSTSEGHKDNHLSHIPDMRSFWGDGDPWHARIQKYSRLARIRDSADHALTGTYMLLYTPEGNGLTLNQRWSAGVSGDACIVKLSKNMWGRGGAAAYEDIDTEFLESGLYRKMLMGLFD
ncbi:hypothetical protein DSL72_001595 [Monilinia vaccinii-corymbosi]|uniref:Uncharacterized protein n=1 Tax=Monilinia vaccinii-corymbosi TaxID=61207 RepID=A0A8A3P7M1_9HELO|nr:hypothetical protein DSL72_001595 [Monilinia vaccinii-corymbosi]